MSGFYVLSETVGSFQPCFVVPDLSSVCLLVFEGLGEAHRDFKSWNMRSNASRGA